MKGNPGFKRLGAALAPSPSVTPAMPGIRVKAAKKVKKSLPSMGVKGMRGIGGC